jgi:anti-sigma factor RsiW
MSDLHLNFSAQPHEHPGDDDAREARHQVLATLLGAYSDGELPAETASQIDAHLLGCARCRREVDVHGAMRARLSHEPVVTASAAFRDRIMLELANAAVATAPASAVALPAPWWRSMTALVTAAVAVVAIAAAFGVDRARGVTSATAAHATAVDAARVPLLSAILTDYRRVTASDLPGRARDLDAVRAAVPFPVQPLRGGTARLLAVWSTDLAGEPAAVLAYRWHDSLVLEYLVGEPAFFRHPGVRAPIAAGDIVTSRSGTQSVLAWAAPESGAILIGDVAPAELMALRLGDTGR